MTNGQAEPTAAPRDVTLAVPPQLEPLIHLVLGEPGLHERMGLAATPDAFADTARAVCAEHGLAFDEAVLRNALRPDPHGLGRWPAAPVTLATWPAGDWLPTRSVPGGDTPAFDWAWFGKRRLTEPFYEDSVRRDGTTPLNLLLRTRTGLEALLAGAAGADAVPLTGLVFHMSRCGSTLLARMLGAIPRHAVASEPEPFDAVLQWARQPGVPHDLAVAAIRAMATALGRRRAAEAQRFFIKLDAWHTLSLPLLREAFPEVPWLYLYREPVEVLASQMELPGVHTIPGGLPPTLFTIPGGETMPREDYCARVLARIGGAVLEHWSLGGGLTIDYAELREAALDAIPAHFGFVPDASERAAMAEAGGADAKRPDQRFVADAERKRHAATPAAREAARTHLEPIRQRLAELS